MSLRSVVIALLTAVFGRRQPLEGVHDVAQEPNHNPPVQENRTHCPCGGRYKSSPQGKYQHKKTQMHQLWVALGA